LTFGPDHGGFIGDFSYVMFRGLEHCCLTEHAPSTPAISFALFQLMFAAIAPLLITGAVAGRMRLPSFLIFAVWWHISVYVFVAHWVWGDGFLAQMGAQDFAYDSLLHLFSVRGSFL
jgi:Amt family ammonium transporter